MNSHAIFACDDRGADTEQLAWVEPASPEDVSALLAEPMQGHDHRSPWVWVRLQDGTLMLATFPQGGTYEKFSEAGVCDWNFPPPTKDQAFERLDTHINALRAMGCAVIVLTDEDIQTQGPHDDNDEPLVSLEAAGAWLRQHQRDVEEAVLGEYWGETISAILDQYPIQETVGA